MRWKKLSCNPRQIPGLSSAEGNSADFLCRRRRALTPPRVCLTDERHGRRAYEIQIPAFGSAVGFCVDSLQSRAIGVNGSSSSRAWSIGRKTWLFCLDGSACAPRLVYWVVWLGLSHRTACQRRSWRPTECSAEINARLAKHSATDFRTQFPQQLHNTCKGFGFARRLVK